MSATASPLPNRLGSVNIYLQVLHALMLRDMRTRFGGSYWGFGVTVLWPVTHIFVLTAFAVFRSMPAPMGDSVVIFMATGAVPCLLFQYISRELMKAVIVNKPLTYYPQVKKFDLIFARTLVEIVVGFSALIVVFAIIVALGIDPRPADTMTALTGYLAAILLGLGIGTLNVGIVTFFPGWLMGYMLFTIVLYLSSGVLFMPVYMPAELYAIMKWNPMVQIIEWVRLGYDPGAPMEVDYLYVMIWIGVTITLGLLTERYLVRHN